MILLAYNKRQIKSQHSMMLFKLLWASVLSRKAMAILTCFSIAISMLVLLSVAHIEVQVRQNFERSVSGVDLIVGSRTSQLNLLLFSIFKMGYPSNNLQGHSFSIISANPMVEWAVPIALGDSHQGYGVVGTTPDYFSHLKYADKQALVFGAGQSFKTNFQVVLGAAAAKALAYTLGDNIVLAHGAGRVSFTHHTEHPFTVVGLLKPTGTPMDRSIYIPIQSVEILHNKISAQHSESADLQTEHELDEDPHIQQLSAVLVGAKSRIAILSLQREISQFEQEPLTAILPGLVLRELWQMMSVVEISLSVVSILVLFAALIGMTTMLLASMRERRQELSILRALGAKPWLILLLVEAEALLLTLLGCVMGYAMLCLGLILLEPMLLQTYSFNLNPYPDIRLFMAYSLMALLLAMLLALFPAISAYFKSLRSGLSFN
jgi:putative ABC transport system permease protein